MSRGAPSGPTSSSSSCGTHTDAVKSSVRRQTDHFCNSSRNRAAVLRTFLVLFRPAHARRRPNRARQLVCFPELIDEATANRDDLKQGHLRCAGASAITIEISCCSSPTLSAVASESAGPALPVVAVKPLLEAADAPRHSSTSPDGLTSRG